MDNQSCDMDDDTEIQQGMLAPILNSLPLPAGSGRLRSRTATQRTANMLAGVAPVLSPANRMLRAPSDAVMGNCAIASPVTQTRRQVTTRTWRRRLAQVPHFVNPTVQLSARTSSMLPTFPPVISRGIPSGLPGRQTPNMCSMPRTSSTGVLNNVFVGSDTPTVQSLLHDYPVPMVSETVSQTPNCAGRSRRQVVPTFSLVPPMRPYVLPYAPACLHCLAKRFHKETPGFCCASGQVNLASHLAPHALWKLFTDVSPSAKEFQTYVRTYNNQFAFTSFGVKSDKTMQRRLNGIYTFKAQGQMYHFMDTLVPLGQSPPSHLQLYFYDTAHEIENRLLGSDRMKLPIIERLLDILKDNPYTQFFRSLATLPNLTDCAIVIRNLPTQDQRVYNAPTSSQVAAIWVEGEGSGAHTRDIVIVSKPGLSVKVCHYYGCYDSLQYPLLFPLGEPGWHQGIKRYRLAGTRLPPLITSENIHSVMASEENGAHSIFGGHKTVSCREYYSYKLQIRPERPSLLLRAGRLFQQFVVDMYIKLESTRLDFFTNNQIKIRANLYGGIFDSLADGERQGAYVGSRIVLPASFIGGARDMRRRFLDAMTLCRRYGKPDLFVTMTCNPNWPEIKLELARGEEAQNRPDLLSRVFRAKVEEFKSDMLKKKLFGPVAAYVYVIEFQKRGLPHLHMLMILEDGYKIRSSEQFDKYVSAEIPDQCENPNLYHAVWKHMMHGPCGELCPDNVCMQRGNKCTKHYPKEYQTHTSQREDSYPLYRRRNNKRTLRVRKHDLDNRWVVPYNAYLLAKFDCHINVEICSTVKAVKYLYKYIYKGHDRVSFNMSARAGTQIVDEVSNFRDGRWVGPPEAMWRIYGFDLNDSSPPVTILQLHLENQHTIIFKDSMDLQEIADSPLSAKTTLTGYFDMNRDSAFARKLLYSEFPEFYVWNKADKQWTLRKKGKAIGRIVSVNPSEGERWYLKLLLTHVRGATCYDDLKTVGGTVCQSFREAAVLNGLVQEDECFRMALAEACSYQMPISLRRLFCTLLGYCNPANARALWEEFSGVLSEDYLRDSGVTQHAAEKMALRDIGFQLESMSKNINEYKLVDYDIVCDEADRGNKEITDELGLGADPEDLDNVSLLNNEQKQAFDLIMERILRGEAGAFFVDGPGGTGKSFLYKCLLAKVRQTNGVALATASSGVAAALMDGGRTAHSRFKIPLDLDEGSSCTVKKQSGLAKLIRMSKLIIWDEAPMVRRQAIEVFEQMLQDICSNSLPFGGKVVVFGGDFRQVLPVVPKGSAYETIQASLVKSPLWPTFTKIKLTTNMRAQLDKKFADYLLTVGEGTVPYEEDDIIAIPPLLALPYTGPESLDELIKLSFPDLHSYAYSLDSIINRAILSTTNEFVDEINETIICRFPGEFREYKSYDNAVENSKLGLQEDFYNSLTPSGYPPHLLRLKVNCPVILLRNIDPSKGLCNGTRLICKTFSNNTIGAEIATGAHKGKHVFLPRIPLTPAVADKMAFPFSRTQFPIRLCFCMTINKAQGQTLDYVGVYLPQPVFSHGQLYVALSRARDARSIAILVVPPDTNAGIIIATRNVVYKEVLLLANEACCQML